MTLSKEDIMEIIPHREPILLVDEVTILEPGKKATGKFYVDPEMHVLKGHFPSKPVFPGAYTTESMGQVAGVLLLSDEKYRGKLPLYYGSNKVRLFRQVLPGDLLEMQVTLVDENEEKAILTCFGEAYANGEKAAISEMIIAMR